MTFDDAITLYLDASRQLDHSRTHLQCEERLLRRFADYCVRQSARGVQDIAPALLQAYQKWVRGLKHVNGRPLTVPYQNNHIRFVWAWSKFLYDRGLILSDFARDHEKLRDPDRLPRGVMNKEQMMQMLRQPIVTTPIGYHDRTVLELMFSTGLRGGEVCKLTVYDVNLDERLVRVIQGKGKKDRLVPVGKVPAAYLRDYLDQVRPILLRAHQHASVFVKRDGLPLRVEHLKYIVQRYRSKAHLPDSITVHSLRHTCATEMLRGGASVRHVQELLGHSSIQTTQVYTRLVITDLKKAHQRTAPSERRKNTEPVRFDASAAKWCDEGNAAAWRKRKMGITRPIG